MGCKERFENIAERLFFNPTFQPSAAWLEAIQKTEKQSLGEGTLELRKFLRY